VNFHCSAKGSKINRHHGGDDSDVCHCRRCSAAAPAPPEVWSVMIVDFHEPTWQAGSCPQFHLPKLGVRGSYADLPATLDLAPCNRWADRRTARSTGSEISFPLLAQGVRAGVRIRCHRTRTCWWRCAVEPAHTALPNGNDSPPSPWRQGELIKQLGAIENEGVAQPRLYLLPKVNIEQAERRQRSHATAEISSASIRM
jgi:hypothetical protein